MENKNGETAFIASARAGQTECCEELLKLGARVDYENNYGHTALTLLAKDGNERMIRELRRLGADLDHETTFGNTAVMQVMRSLAPEHASRYLGG